MKKVFLLLFLGVATVFFAGCKKDKGVVPVTTTKTYPVTFTVAAGQGTVSPASKTVSAGQSITITFTPANGYQLDKVLVNKIVTSVTNNTLTLDVSSKIDGAVSFVAVSQVDTLTTQQLDSLNNILLSGTGSWSYASAESKVDGSVFNWQELFQYYPCVKDDYLKFSAGHNLLWSINGTSCSTTWKTADESGQYSLDSKGEIIFSHDSKIDTIIVNKITADSLVVTSRDAYQARTAIRYHCVPKK
jgi:hypothetical protein